MGIYMLTDFLYRLRALFRRNAGEDELDAELRFHFERQVEKYVASGLDRAEAVPQCGSALPDYNALRRENNTFVDMGAYHWMVFSLTETDGPEQIEGRRFTAGLWSILRVQPLLGALFTSSAEEWGPHRVAV